MLPSPYSIAAACSYDPSERLAKIALDNRDRLLARNCAIVDDNLPKWDAFFASHPDLFDWYRPDVSPVR